MALPFVGSAIRFTQEAIVSEETESFIDFKNSFSYGSRTDLNFKFLKGLSEEAAADFFQQLLWKLGDAYDSDDWSSVIAHVQDGQAANYAGASRWAYDDAPHTPLGKPLDAATIALITSTGHFVEGDDPKPFGIEEMTQDEAAQRIDDFLREEPTLSEIPVDTPHHRLRARHGGYDVRGVLADHNVALPIDRLRALADEGIIGSLHPTAYSFVGACAQTPLTKRTAPTWAAMWKSAGIDGAVLVPV